MSVFRGYSTNELLAQILEAILSTGLPSGFRNLIGIIDSVSGESTSLDTITTADDNIPINTMVGFIVGTVYHQWVLLTGTQSNDDTHQRPLDWNETTNAKVWNRVI